MGAWECRCTKSLLSLVHHFTSRYAQYECCLIGSSSHGCYSIPTFPSPVYSFTWIKKIKLNNLKNQLAISIMSHNMYWLIVWWKLLAYYVAQHVLAIISIPIIINYQGELKIIKFKNDNAFS